MPEYSDVNTIKIIFLLLKNNIFLIKTIKENYFNMNKDEDYFETSILSDENIINNKENNIKEKIKYFKEFIKTTYWDEINLNAYKMELLEKNKNEEYLKKFNDIIKEIKERIIYIGNQIGKYFTNL